MDPPRERETDAETHLEPQRNGVVLMFLFSLFRHLFFGSTTEPFRVPQLWGLEGRSLPVMTKLVQSWTDRYSMCLLYIMDFPLGFSLFSSVVVLWAVIFCYPKTVVFPSPWHIDQLPEQLHSALWSG